MAQKTRQAYQYEAPVTPSKWTGEEQRFSLRVKAALEDLYQKFGRLSSNPAADSEKLGGKAPEYYLTPVNLLDNSDFRKPVNQRGQTSYTASGYTIDRWRIWDGGSVTVNDGYITIGGNTVFQYIQLSSLKNMEHTLAIKRLDGTIALVVNNPRNAYLWSSCVGLGTTDNNLTIISIDSSDIVWAALYEGSYTADTLPPYVPKGYAAELMECQRYYQKYDALGIVVGVSVEANQPYYRGSFVFPAMRLTPTITNVELNTEVPDFFTEYNTEKTCVFGSNTKPFIVKSVQLNADL